ncbi:uncharacterized protein (DUF2252 family) [Alkalihalobacillus xiaoxiensis]|uniref:Uncharacterized protein (DUF2252 family) n=1 Tax=Shouchella xiaoxiensis TaxID=766895 RepID=A0ABS2SYQ9_9BACI|nr:DUF2252 family protein [Shouchella xiaoxiensis]MBM7839352.1 uncharacterized protein (DUF2252 family) [Shouchella xiaoxiensis]
MRKATTIVCLSTLLVVSSSILPVLSHAEEKPQEAEVEIDHNEQEGSEETEEELLNTSTETDLDEPVEQDEDTHEVAETPAETTQSEDTSTSTTAIEIPDEELQSIILATLADHGYDEITTESVQTITTLDARSAGIQNLDGIQHLSELEALDLRENAVTDITPLANLTKLTELNLASNQLETVGALTDLTQLKEIDLRNNSIRGLTPLTNLTQLEKLDLRGNAIESIAPLANLTELTELNLRENAVSDLTPLARLTNLIELNLHTNQVNDLSPLKDLVKIEYLTMRRNHITDISVLAELTQLRDLNLRDNQLTSIEALRNHQQLTERLNLRDNPGLTDFSPVQSYYDLIADVDFVIASTEKNFDDLTLLTGESRLSAIQNQLLRYNTFINDGEIRQTKIGLLDSSALSFYRGTAHLFFNDIATGAIQLPAEWQAAPYLTWTTGDWHTENIGFYGNDKLEPVFDLNDFDEAAVAPFTYDLLRFATSVYLVNDHAPGLQLSYEEINTELTQFIAAYAEALNEVEQGTINVNSFYFSANQLDGIVGSLAQELSSVNRFAELDKWTTITDSTRLFDQSNNRLGQASDQEKEALLTNWDTYTDSTKDDSPDYFQVKDIAKRLDAGLGSLGTERYYVLIEGESSSSADDIILDVKSQLPSAVKLAGLGHTPNYETHAERTISGVNAMHNHPDRHWGTLTMNGTSYLVKERSAFKDEFDHSAFQSQEDLQSFLHYSARVAAFAHARGAEAYGNEAFVQQTAQLTQASDFTQTFNQLAYQHYAQTIQDHSYYSELLRNNAFSEEAFQAIGNDEDDETEQPEDEENTDAPAEEDQGNNEPPVNDDDTGNNDEPSNNDDSNNNDGPSNDNDSNNNDGPSKNDYSNNNDGPSNDNDLNNNDGPSNDDDAGDTTAPPQDEEGGLLPKTASSYLLYIVASLFLVAAGIVLRARVKKEEAEE